MGQVTSHLGIKRNRPTRRRRDTLNWGVSGATKGATVREGASDRRDPLESQRISRELLQKIGEMDPYAGTDPAEVEERLRNMSFGATNSRISKLRKGDDAHEDPADSD